MSGPRSRRADAAGPLPFAVHRQLHRVARRLGRDAPLQELADAGVTTGHAREGELEHVEHEGVGLLVPLFGELRERRVVVVQGRELEQDLRRFDVAAQR